MLVDDSFPLALLGRAIVGIGSGAGFVAGLDLVRIAGGGPVLQGLYGGATMVGGGLALMIVPSLTDATGWRAAYWSGAVLALASAAPALAARGLPRVGHAGPWVIRDTCCSRSASSRRPRSVSPSLPATGRCRFSSAGKRAPRQPVWPAA